MYEKWNNEAIKLLKRMKALGAFAGAQFVPVVHVSVLKKMYPSLISPPTHGIAALFPFPLRQSKKTHFPFVRQTFLFTVFTGL